MKIKLLINIGSAVCGDIVEAITPKNPSNAAYFYDSDDVYWGVHKAHYEIVKEPETKSKALVLSIRDLLGQDIKTLEFK